MSDNEREDTDVTDQNPVDDSQPRDDEPAGGADDKPELWHMELREADDNWYRRRRADRDF
jgi:hypothetical protein